MLILYSLSIICTILKIWWRIKTFMSASDVYYLYQNFEGKKKGKRKRKRADIRISKRNYHRIEINEEHCWKARSLLFLDLIEIIFRKCFMLKSFFFILRDWVHVTGQLAINIYIYIWLFGPIKLLGLYILEVIL